MQADNELCSTMIYCMIWFVVVFEMYIILFEVSSFISIVLICLEVKRFFPCPFSLSTGNVYKWSIPLRYYWEPGNTDHVIECSHLLFRRRPYTSSLLTSSRNATRPIHRVRTGIFWKYAFHKISTRQGPMNSNVMMTSGAAYSRPI
jgi:hypothetical protein